MKIKTIEQIAKVLLKNKLEFSYSRTHLEVKDEIVKYQLFSTATYHHKTGELVLMYDAYRWISIEQFLIYFGMLKEKTIGELLTELPEPYATQAIENTSDIMLNAKRPNLKAAIIAAFEWKDSPQGQDYWITLDKTLSEF